MRNKRALSGVFFNAIFFSFFILSLYWKVGDFPDLTQIAKDQGIQKAQEEYQTYVANIRGLAFMLSNQLSISASMNAVLQVPMQAPVMRRELANKMYSPSAYYLGRFTSNLILQFLYPVIMILAVFWCIDISTDIENFIYMMSFGLLGNFVFCGQGFFWGIAVTDEDRVKLVNQFNVIIFIMCNGALTNLTTANWLISFLSKVSPGRFNCEGFFRALTKQIQG